MAQPAVPWQDEWLARFNRERTTAGIARLRPCPVLALLAQEEAERMAREGLRELPLETVQADLRRVGYAAHEWRENVVLSSEGPGSLILSPMESWHALRDGRFRDFGVGTAPTPRGTLYVFLFGWHQEDFFAGATAGLADPARVLEELRARVNEARRREGLPPLARNLLLDRLAQEHADDMLRRSYVSHQTPEGLGPSDRGREAGYPSGIAENIVEQRFSAEEAMGAWMDSPGHRRNILDPNCRELGLGLAVGAGYGPAPDGYKVIWVQSFGCGSR
ncbi:MAG: CAP domain-containing protein [Thermoanaerobaculia bacterium]